MKTVSNIMLLVLISVSIVLLWAFNLYLYYQLLHPKKKRKNKFKGETPPLRIISGTDHPIRPSDVGVLSHHSEPTKPPLPSEVIQSDSALFIRIGRAAFFEGKKIKELMPIFGLGESALAKQCAKYAKAFKLPPLSEWRMSKNRLGEDRVAAYWSAKDGSRVSIYCEYSDAGRSLGQYRCIVTTSNSVITAASFQRALEIVAADENNLAIKDPELVERR